MTLEQGSDQDKRAWAMTYEVLALCGQIAEGERSGRDCEAELGLLAGHPMLGPADSTPGAGRTRYERVVRVVSDLGEAIETPIPERRFPDETLLCWSIRLRDGLPIKAIGRLVGKPGNGYLQYAWISPEKTVRERMWVSKAYEPGSVTMGALPGLMKIVRRLEAEFAADRPALEAADEDDGEGAPLNLNHNVGLARPEVITTNQESTDYLGGGASSDGTVKVIPDAAIPSAGGDQPVAAGWSPTKRSSRIVLAAIAVLVISLAVALAASGTWPFDSNPAAIIHLPPPSAISAFGSTCPATRAVTDPLPPAGNAVVSVRLLAQRTSSKSWYNYLGPVAPEANVRYLLAYRNGSEQNQNQVILRANLAPGTLLVPDSTCLYDESHPRGLWVSSNDVNQGGVNGGNFGPGAAAYLLFSVAMPPTGDLDCGSTSIITVGVAHPLGMNEFENSAQVGMDKSCEANGSPGSGTDTAADTLQVRARLPGESPAQWADSAPIPAGDPVEWGIQVAVGTTQETNGAIVLDEIPSGLVVVPGSVRVYNGNFPNGYTYPDSVIQSHGTQININIGDYLPLTSPDQAHGLLSAQVIFDTEFAFRTPDNCKRRTVTNTAWFGSPQFPDVLHASAKANVSC